MPRRRLLAVLSAPTLAVLSTCPFAQEVSEKDYFGDLPVVLSVSRLAQPLDETPGAVTIIDRELIRRSGARELAEVLRLVPGFVTGQINGANPMANYHGDFDSLNRRLQVFVDGRSVFSTLLVGNVGHPMMGVVLDDIERIEVLRGSNSAAQGSNAFSGVVNIITRDAADVPEVSVAVTGGEKGILDRSVRARIGDERLAFRVTAARRDDNGLDNLADNKRVDQLHLRGDLRPSAADHLSVFAGSINHEWEVQGTPAVWRKENWRNAYVHGKWQHQLSETNSLTLKGSIDEENYIDSYPRFPLKADGRGRRLSLEGAHTTALNQMLRLVWGAEFRREEVQSRALFNTDTTQNAQMWRLFGNVEWRPHPKWLINAGGLWEDHTIVGPRTSPRLMVNYHLLPDHTLRVGSTQAYRMPTLFELRGDWRVGGVPFVRATGGLKPERLVSDEIGYLGHFRGLALTVDVRGFEEAGSSLARYFGAAPNDVVNKDRYRKRGWETQLRWRPLDGTEVLFNHTQIRIRSWATGNTQLSDQLAAPSHFSTLAIFHRLPAEFDFSVIATEAEQMTWGTINDLLPASRQIDLRLAKGFRFGTTRAEAAIAVQAATGSHQEFSPTQRFTRRAFATLRLDF